ncbi:unnamed protein product [Bursaphelenchus xylophilus]|uniref:(pine wood nematode) hypothetical protein n=1 Tax=Bursaphelenchus xylophilus TaxID=6326 RepID=A0A1I7S6Y9_BURXY|nr:unnamed protein product [Bursaphelenchus xylophilus]CAG9079559.1 unnamed protein product [Bursaphelenchus xylophilus]
MFLTIETTKISELSVTVEYDKAILQEKITNKCEFENPCSTDGDCGHKGICIGGRITKRCACVCSNFRKCKHDSKCGLNGACDLRHSFCNCTKAYHDHGLGSMENVRRTFVTRNHV